MSETLTANAVHLTLLGMVRDEGIDPLRVVRKKEVVMARVALANVLISVLGMNPGRVGILFRKDRTTVIHYRDSHLGWYKSSQEYRYLYSRLHHRAMELWAGTDEVSKLIDAL